MKNIIKPLAKPLALISAAAILACTTGCADTSWCFKTKYSTLSAGTYIYYTYMAYNEATSKVSSSSSSSSSTSSESSKDVMSQKIEGKSADEWIANKAKEECISQMTMDKLIKDAKITVDDTELETYTSYYEQNYQSGASAYKQLGISKDSFLDATATYSELSEQLFESIYNKGGTKEVAEKDIEAYFKKNYVTYFYIPYALKTTDSSGNSTNIDDATKEKATTNLNKYVTMLNKNGKTTDDVVKQYETDFSVTQDPSTSDTAVLADSGIGSDLQKAISGLKEKEAKLVTIDDSYYLIYKGAIADKVSTLSDTSTKLNQKTKVLHKMKDDEYKKYIDEQESKLKYDTNEDCLSKYSVSRTVNIVKSIMDSASATAAA